MLALKMIKKNVSIKNATKNVSIKNDTKNVSIEHEEKKMSLILRRVKGWEKKWEKELENGEKKRMGWGYGWIILDNFLPHISMSQMASLGKANLDFSKTFGL